MFGRLLLCRLPKHYMKSLIGTAYSGSHAQFTGGQKMKRITEHPILGKIEKGRKVNFTFDGREFAGYEGEPIAAALKANGVAVHRYTAKLHKPRGIFCAIGRCTDCVMVIDGKPNIRTCITPLREGMNVQTQYGTGAKKEGAAER